MKKWFADLPIILRVGFCFLFAILSLTILARLWFRFRYFVRQNKGGNEVPLAARVRIP